jgi:hypothetical protein
MKVIKRDLPAHKGIIKKPLKTNLPGFEPML